MLQKIIPYFFPKKIVYSNGFPKGILIKSYEYKGRKYVTIAVTRVAMPGVPNPAVIYQIPISKIIGIQRSITPFQRWFYNLIKKPLPRYTLKPIKK